MSGRLEENCITRLSTTAAVDMKTVAKVSLYTVPTGKKAIVTKVVVKNPTASLAGGTDYDLGDGAACDTWLQAVDLATMTAVTDGYIISSDNIKYTILDAGDVFGIKPITGSTLAATAEIDVFGYEFDA